MPHQIQRPLLFFGYLIFTWTTYRYFFTYPEWVDEFIAKPLVMLLPTLLLVKYIEKKKFTTLGLTKINFIRNTSLGFFIGMILVIELLVISFVKYGEVIFNPDNVSSFGIFLFIAASCATGFVEEFVYRGYFFTRFNAYYKNEILANIFSTILFVGVHFPILFFFHKYNTSSIILPLLQLSVMSFLNGFLFARTKSLVPSTIAHAMWNASIVLFR